MLKELIDKLKQSKNQIQKYKNNNNDVNTWIKVHDEKEVGKIEICMMRRYLFIG